MRRPVAIVLLIAFAFTGCYKWTATDGLPRHLQEEEQTVRLSFADSSQVVLRAARVRGDSLIGQVPTSAAGQSGYRQTVYELPLTNVVQIEVRKQDSTVPWVILGTAGGLAVTALIMCRDDSILC